MPFAFANPLYKMNTLPTEKGGTGVGWNQKRAGFWSQIVKDIFFMIFGLNIPGTLAELVQSAHSQLKLISIPGLECYMAVGTAEHGPINIGSGHTTLYNTNITLHVASILVQFSQRDLLIFYLSIY